MRARLSTEVGHAVRKLRMAKGLTLAQLSDRSGVPLSSLSKAELGQVALTHDKLLRLCRALDVDLERTLWMEAETAPMAAGRRSVIRAGEGEPGRLGPHATRAAAGELLSKSFSPLFVDIEVSDLADHGPLQTGAGEMFLLVLEGAVVLHSEVYAPLRLAAGDSIYFDGRAGYALLAEGGPAKAMLVVTGEEAV